MNEPNDLILVIDVPLYTTPEEAAALLNEPLARGYYMTTVLGWSGVPERPEVGARAFFKQRMRTESAVSQTLEAKATQFIRDNRELPVTQLCAGLKALKFVRSPKWVTAKRMEIVVAERRMAAPRLSHCR